MVARFAGDHAAGSDRWCVALSGGPDSLALTAAAAAVLPTTALIVDHGLQPGSRSVAGEAARARVRSLAGVSERAWRSCGHSVAALCSSSSS